MTLIDRYLFRQLLGPILAASAALIGVALLAQSLNQLELIVERGQSAWVLMRVTALAVPQLLSLILPVGVFVGALLALNRLHTEQEIVVCYAGGMSRWRVVAPAMRVAVLITLLALAATTFIQPAAQRAAREQLFAVKTDLASTLVREGEFTQASPDLTIYTARVDQNGLMRDMLIYVTRPGGQTAYDAAEGRIANRNGEPVLVLNRGSSSEFSDGGVLNFLSFDQYVFDLTPFVPEQDVFYYKDSDRWLHELFFPNLEVEYERNQAAKLAAEGHARLSSPLYNIAFMALALTAVLGGAFNRLGYARRIARYAALAAVFRILGFVVAGLAQQSVWLNVLQYAVPLFALWLALKIMFRARIGAPGSARPLASDLNWKTA